MAVVVSNQISLNQRLQDMPGVVQLLQLVALAAAVALGLWLFFQTQSPSHAPLFAGLADRDAAEVTEALRSTGIPYKLDPGSGAILVPETQLQDARLRLAAQGLPNGSKAGFEMIQGEQGFGVSQFVEGARYQLAMETELARTIASLRPVKDARVHLAIPKPSAFTRGREPAGASVMVDLYAGRALDGNQVAAIQHMVATSVPNLSPDRVTVIDQSGRLLTIPDPTSDAALSARQFEQVRRMETSYAERITQLLEPLTGLGRVSAQVNVEMDFAMTEEARETYADPGRVRSEQTNEQSSQQLQAGAVPGATPNTPLGIDAGGQSAGGPSSALRTVNRSYELDRTLTHTRQAPGRLTRVNAAVLVDHVSGLNAEGEKILRPLDEAELERVQALVRDAVGFNAERGDSVTVMNAPFARPEPMAELEPLPFYEEPSIKYWAKLLLGSLVVLVLVLSVLRPTVNKILAGPPRRVEAHAYEGDDDDEQLLDEEGEPLRLGRRRADHATQLPPPQTPDQEAMGILAGPANYEQRLQVARSAVTQDPRRVAQVVRGWVNTDG
jgi:flagellar M-ring protein FliF